MLTRFGVPKGLVIAAAILTAWAIYGLLQSMAGLITGNSWQFLTLVSSASTLWIVWRLFHQDRRAWWAAVLVVGLKLTLSLPAFSALVYYSLQVPGPMSSLVNDLGLYRVLSDFWVLYLTIAFCLLLSPSSRAAFRVPALVVED